MEHSQELAQEIRARISELEDDLEAHRRALAVLEGPDGGTHEGPQAHSQSGSGAARSGRAQTRAQTVSSGPATNGAAASRPAPKRRPRPEVSAEAVFDALADGSDQAAVIAHEFGVSTATVRQRLEQLEQAGRVSRSGQRRGTRWRSNAA